MNASVALDCVLFVQNESTNTPNCKLMLCSVTF